MSSAWASPCSSSSFGSPSVASGRASSTQSLTPLVACVLHFAAAYAELVLDECAVHFDDVQQTILDYIYLYGHLQFVPCAACNTGLAHTPPSSFKPPKQLPPAGEHRGVEPIGSFTDANGVVYMRPEFAYRTRSQSRSMSRGRPASVASSRPIPTSTVVVDPPLTVRQTAAVALMFCGLWFFANWSMNASLAFTSVSSTTILSSMSGLFTLAVGSCVGVETVTAHKAASVVLSILGVVLISRGDASANSAGGHGHDVMYVSAAPKAVLGDLLALLSALAYAFYVVLLKFRIRTEARVSMTLFFGFVGLFNILLIWPAGFVLHVLAIETWEWPRGGRLWLNIALNAMITFVSDAIYVRAMLMTSPLAVTLGISLTIPLALAGDLYRGTPLSWKVIVGGALVLGSFVANGLLDYRVASREDSEPVKVVDFDDRSDEQETDALLSEQ
ncbi:hypothetical protein OIV83_003069 [Microbotryomycetes sp. JL201]|nr:hypothetical protein OIV83_003069 [Microbotryomycetes sp. JL201]